MQRTGAGLGRHAGELGDWLLPRYPVVNPFES